MKLEFGRTQIEEVIDRQGRISVFAEGTCR